MTAVTADKFAAMTPLPSVAKGRVTAVQCSTWSEYEKLIRTCFRCGSVYSNAGHAWSSEHWHERLRTS